jgi:hypothetical protein
MMRPTEQPAASGISRREAIRRAALLAGIVLTPEWLSVVDRASASTAAQGLSLTPSQGAMVGAIADRILPRTDTPGAIDVGVPAFIALLYGEFMTPAEQKMLTDGLDGVETAARSARGASFVTLTADRQDELLRSIAKAEEGRRLCSATSRRSRLARPCCTTILCRAVLSRAFRSSRWAGATGRPDSA